MFYGWQKLLVVVSCVIAGILTLFFVLNFVGTYFGFTSHGGEAQTRLTDTEVQQRKIIREADERKIKNLAKGRKELQNKLKKDKKLEQSVEIATNPECEGMLTIKGVRINGKELCTHGADETPTSLDNEKDVKGIFSVTSLSSFQCSGTGDDGYRIQPIFLYNPAVSLGSVDVPSKIKSALLTADSIYYSNSLAKGGYRRLRFVTDAACNLKVITLQITDPTINSDINLLLAAMAQNGYTQSDRIYVGFTNNPQSGTNAGLGTRYINAPNSNPVGPTYSVIYNWSGAVAAHELGHNLGAVLPNSPFSDGIGHSVDYYDLMNATLGVVPPGVTIQCPDGRNATNQQVLVDCNNNDYFNLSPDPVSFIGTNWNIAFTPFFYQGSTNVAVPTPTPTLVPPPSAGVTCTITTDNTSPTSGQSTSFSAQCNDYGNKLSRITLYYSPTSAESWAGDTIANCTFSGNAGSGVCQGSHTWNVSAGSAYYVIVNGFTSDNRPCTGNPWQVPYPWYDCSNIASGNKDVVTVSIAASSTTASGTDAPTPTPDFRNYGDSSMSVTCSGLVNGNFTVINNGIPVSGTPLIWMDDRIVGVGSNTASANGDFTYQITGTDKTQLTDGVQHKIGATLNWDGTYQTPFNPGQDYTAPGIAIRYIACTAVPTPTPAPQAQSNAPTCSISGPTSVTPGSSTNYAGSCTDSQGNLSQVELYWSPTSSESWNLMGTCPASGSSATCSQSATFNSTGTYYVAVNGYKSSSNVGSGSTSTRCTGNPFQLASGWSDCGGGDYATVTVSNTTVNNPQPTQAPCPSVISAPTSLTQSSNVIQWNSVQYATDYMVRIDNTSQNGWSGLCNSMNAGDACQDFWGTTSYSFAFAPSTSYHVWVHGYNSTCGVWGNPAELNFTTPASNPPTAYPTNPPRQFNPPTPTPTRIPTPTPVAPTATPIPYNPSTWTYCATENAYCYLPGPATVRYGAYGFYTYKIVSSSGITCSNSAFGSDPIMFVKKSCDYRLSASTVLATPTPIPPTATPTPTPIPDTQPPTVSITSPQSGAKVTKNTNVTIYATAQDNVEVAKVEFYINNTLQCTDTVAPYSCTFKTVNKGGVKIPLEARVYDTVNLWSSRGIQVTTK